MAPRNAVGLQFELTSGRGSGQLETGEWGRSTVLEDHRDDPVTEEPTSFVSSLSEDEQIDLVALARLGRDDNSIGDWPALRAAAARAHRPRRTHTVDYLLGMPLLGDQLEEALSMLGSSCQEFEIDRL